MGMGKGEERIRAKGGEGSSPERVGTGKAYAAILIKILYAHLSKRKRHKAGPKADPPYSHPLPTHSPAPAQGQTAGTQLPQHFCHIPWRRLLPMKLKKTQDKFKYNNFCTRFAAAVAGSKIKWKLFFLFIWVKRHTHSHTRLPYGLGCGNTWSERARRGTARTKQTICNSQFAFTFAFN